MPKILTFRLLMEELKHQKRINSLVIEMHSQQDIALIEE